MTKCKHCGRRMHCGRRIILLWQDEGRDHWRHAVIVGDWAGEHAGSLTFTAGCRAASFDRDGAWDDSMPQSWKATPAPSPEARYVGWS